MPLDVVPTADLPENYAHIIQQLCLSGAAIAHPESMDAAEYNQHMTIHQGLLHELEELETMRNLRRGIAQMERGEGKNLWEAFAEIEARLPRNPA